MRKIFRGLCFAPAVAVAVLFAGPVVVRGADAVPVLQSATLDDAVVTRRVDALLAQMTLAEKIGQLTQIGPNPIAPGKDPQKLIREGLAGSVLWTVDTAQINRFQKIALEESRLHIPLLFGFDVVHGFKTCLPVPLAMASTWDPALVRRGAELAAKESYAAGINWTFAPMVDIARDARWGRMVEGAGEDPYLGAAMSRAQVLGFQGPSLGTPGRILCSVKHFAGYGAADGGRDYDSCYIPEVTFRNVYLPPFQAAIDAKVGAVMCAYMSLNDLPASGNAWLLRDVLRDGMGFKGFVISDSYSVLSLVNHGLARDPSDAAYRGFEAGVNMDMGSETYLDNAAALVKSGKLSITVVDEMVRQVLEVKIRMGLFEHPYGNTADKEKVFADSSRHDIALTAAQESLVLLRNENKLLPLSKTVKSVAVIGPLADSADDTRGPWTVEGDGTVTILAGIRKAVPNAAIRYVAGGDVQRAYAMPWDAREGKPAPVVMTAAEMQKQEIAVIEAAKASDVVVMVLGERANMSGEAASSASLALGGNQMELLRIVVAMRKPVVLVLLNGRPLDISWASENVPAILEAWYPGGEGGTAVAGVLFGDVNPSGRLPVSWPRSAGQCPVYYAHDVTQAPETDSFFTSRYADVSSSPLYPFGYGLSYTTFAFANLALDKAEIAPDGSLVATVEVTNTGDRDGDEVVQLYIHQRFGGMARPARELKGFERVSLKPGETRKVSFRLGAKELRYWSPLTKTWTVDAADFDIWVGGDCRAPLHAQFSVK
jgi:beta-glucosidase